MVNIREFGYSTKLGLNVNKKRNRKQERKSNNKYENKEEKRKLNLLSQRFKSNKKVARAENTKAKTFQF